MKRTVVVVAAAVMALAATGFAVAKGLDDGNNRSARALSGVFAATTPSRVETRTCTTADGKTIVSTNGTYTGAASGDVPSGVASGLSPSDRYKALSGETLGCAAGGPTGPAGSGRTAPRAK